LVFGQGGTDVKAHLVTDELTYLADWMDMSASEGLLHQLCVEALRKGCEKLRNYTLLFAVTLTCLHQNGQNLANKKKKLRATKRT